jgi:hypothetical protein
VTSRHKHRILSALNIDVTLRGAVAANDSSADLQIPSLIPSSRFHSGDPQFATFNAQQCAWVKEINIGGKSNHTNLSDLIVVKQGLEIAGSKGVLNISESSQRGRRRCLRQRGQDEGCVSGTKLAVQ